ncbi:MAG: hypothetical protein A2275_10835 [Bacteroidetes bacterium RIFOXYA12_FULL_35_11]|nr:MAG: hypothetical protein A2X01_10420 [Bacteroidetes bacterium GWF2_35_48]OFY79636.1 MAG: hypothetical protein A2275_10835 [Bacteroidetes bacterium RIFOXYA12_FULL_35_11]OFY92212.1 MAG: hypothetical protein A2309_06080 [Bacteroidetes bacterium RIFOXYB2_FULL_35_7]OFY98325.1 MAG: hypothetical protein A2491_01675 [Bacteroidetes bacterium RIFOXYC12_FULL_35_7]HBX49937.1 hypothetical protein [Bacteroidales bacterium]
MKKNYSKYTVFLLLGFFVFFLSCTTEKNTLVTRTYHNLTAKYNVFFNGNESLKKGNLKLLDSYKDNYSRILPIFASSDEAAAKAVTPEMDKSIKKASKLIKYHSIKVKPKKQGGNSKRRKAFMAKNEYCNWVDDAYLLMGKAHFFKHDYFQARINFEYVLNQFKTQDIRYDANLWLIRTMIETAQYNKARESLDLMETDKNLPKRIKGEFAAIYADLFLKQKNYEDAASELRKAIDKTRKKKLRTRYKFILAQIYQYLKEYKNASNLYAQVIKMNPPYDMAFNAKINRATCYDVETGDSKGIKKQLEKMLKDAKNNDYQDQIYFALANIYLKENMMEEAMKNLLLSVEKSVSNNDQKSISYLTIADIHFSKLSYKPAQAYYDSAVTLLDSKYPDYDKISLKAANLTELVEYLTIVETEDSLQRVAKMPEKERFAFIDKLIEKIKEEEARQKEEERQHQMNMAFDQQRQGANNTQNQNQGGNWYFYNTATLSYGFAEFKRKWGNRKMEDNWRRKNKAIVISDDLAEDEQGTSQDSTKKPLSNKSREYYTKALPLTDSLMTISHIKIKDALYKLGKTYKEKLQDYPKSRESFESLNKRYPESEYQLNAYYELYLLGNISKNQSLANTYKNLITSKYPDSKYAKLLLNPNYFNELMTNSKIIDELYMQTFDFFKKGNYQEVLNNCLTADASYPENKQVHQFAYMKAVATGRTSNNETLKKELNELIKKYPNTEVIQPAQDILTYLKRGSLSDIKEKMTNSKFFADTATVTETESMLYTFNANTPHFYVVIVANKKEIDANRLSFNISNFNIDYFGMANYSVSSVIMNKDFNLISVKTFENKAQAMSYFTSVKASQDIFKDVSPDDYRHFVINADNFAAFYKDQDINKYNLFFTKKYIEQK